MDKRGEYKEIEKERPEEGQKPGRVKKAKAIEKEFKDRMVLQMHSGT